MEEETKKQENQIPEIPKPVVHTFDADLALAMDTTDAKVVQELLQNARERELIDKETKILKKQRGWYKAGGIILLLFAVLTIGYSIYYYNNLTVDVEDKVRVGIFPSIDPVDTSNTTFENTVQKILNTEISVEKPYLVPLVYDLNSLNSLSKEDLIKYIGAKSSEPFLKTILVMNYGIMNDNFQNVPFFIFYVSDAEIAAKEFMIAESDLLKNFGPSLNIEIERYGQEIGKSFTSGHMYNLPVRTHRTIDPDTRSETILFYYGYVTDKIIVLSTNPTVLRVLYDTIIKQQ